MYPVEFIMILMIVMALQAVCALCGNVVKLARLYPGEDLRIADLLRQNSPWVMALLVMGAGLCGARMIAQKDADTYSNFGLATASRGNIDESIPYFRNALQLAPDNFQVKFNLAFVYMKLEKFEEAVPLFRDIVRIEPGDANSNYILGIALTKSGRYEEGLKYVEEAIRINPNHEDARKFLNMQTNETKSGPS
jgi:tetratricopeptide (TPR) repeat protein